MSVMVTSTINCVLGLHSSISTLCPPPLLDDDDDDDARPAVKQVTNMRTGLHNRQVEYGKIPAAHVGNTPFPSPSHPPHPAPAAVFEGVFVGMSPSWAQVEVASS